MRLSVAPTAPHTRQCALSEPDGEYFHNLMRPKTQVEMGVFDFCMIVPAVSLVLRLQIRHRSMSGWFLKR